MKNVHGTIKSYIFGFALSILLTILAYGYVMIHITSHHQVIPYVILATSILTIAFVQLIVQLIFFLHLGQESAPKWNVVFFIATGCTVLAIIISSIWIMDHLNKNMTQRQINNYIENQSSF